MVLWLAACALLSAIFTIILDREMRAKGDGVSTSEDQPAREWDWKMMAFWAVTLVLAGGLVLGAWLGSRRTEATTLFPAWLEALSTTAAFIAAAVAARYAAGVYRVESDREERQLAHDETAQASQVAAWHHVEKRPQIPGKEWATLIPIHGLMFRNASGYP